MSDELNEQETFRPRRPQTIKQPIKDVSQEEHVSQEESEEIPEQIAATVPQPQFKIKGLENAPKEFINMMKQAKGENIETKQLGNKLRQQPPMSGDGDLKELLEGLKGSTAIYDEILLPSKGQFYDGNDGPSEGILSLRPMTGEEEQILATQRFVKKGQVVNMIFKKCLKENFKPENLLTIDRTYLLIYLRGISYGSDYEVELKCPSCARKFSSTINLELPTEYCPSDYGPLLEDKMPITGLSFGYRLSCGRDEQDIQEYRERRTKMFGDAAVDDTLSYRTAQLITHIDNKYTDKKEIQTILTKLPIKDVSHIRNCIDEAPFGTDTEIEMICPVCYYEFELDLPIESNFFFPRRKKGKKTQV